MDIVKILLILLMGFQIFRYSHQAKKANFQRVISQVFSSVKKQHDFKGFNVLSFNGWPANRRLIILSKVIQSIAGRILPSVHMHSPLMKAKHRRMAQLLKAEKRIWATESISLIFIFSPSSKKLKFAYLNRCFTMICLPTNLPKVIFILLTREEKVSIYSYSRNTERLFQATLDHGH